MSNVDVFVGLDILIDLNRTSLCVTSLLCSCECSQLANLIFRTKLWWKISKKIHTHIYKIYDCSIDGSISMKQTKREYSFLVLTFESVTFKTLGKWHHLKFFKICLTISFGFFVYLSTPRWICKPTKTNFLFSITVHSNNQTNKTAVTSDWKTSFTCWKKKPEIVYKLCSIQKLVIETISEKKTQSQNMKTKFKANPSD